MKMSVEEKCFFPDCTRESQPLIKSGVTRIESIINASKARNDGLEVELQQWKERGYLLNHKLCSLEYTSKSRILAAHKRLNDPDDASLKKRQRRSAPFPFMTHCFFCGEPCAAKDARHPGRYRPWSTCESIGPTNKVFHKTFRENILLACDKQGDWGVEVRLRIGDVSDLVAPGCRYHKDCRMKFLLRSKTKAQSSSESSTWKAVCEVSTILHFFIFKNCIL